MATPMHLRNQVPRSGDRPAIADPRMIWFLNHIANPLVRVVLRSPAHRLLSGHVLLLTYHGRRSGRVYTTPVGYVRGEDALYVMAAGAAHKTWWRNVLEGAPVHVRLKGRDLAAWAEVVSPASIPEAVRTALDTWDVGVPRQPVAGQGVAQPGTEGNSADLDRAIAPEEPRIIRLTPNSSRPAQCR